MICSGDDNDGDDSDDDDLFRKGRFTEINNPYFTAAAQEKLIEKKRLEMTVNTNLTSILSCRCSDCISYLLIYPFTKFFYSILYLCQAPGGLHREHRDPQGQRD